MTLPAQVEVAGDTVWTPTGLDCTAGQRLLLTAKGQVEVDDLGGIALTAEGSQGSTRRSTQPVCVVCSLIGRVGDGGMPFVVGAPLAMECPSNSDLQLGVNDPDPVQNLGTFSVQVSDVTVDPTITLNTLTPIRSTCRPTPQVDVHHHHLRSRRRLLDLGGRRDHVGGGSGAHGRGRRRHGGVRRAGQRPDREPARPRSAQHDPWWRHRRPAAYVRLGTTFISTGGGGRTGKIVLGLNDLDRANNTSQSRSSCPASPPRRGEGRATPTTSDARPVPRPSPRTRNPCCPGGCRDQATLPCR